MIGPLFLDTRKFDSTLNLDIYFYLNVSIFGNNFFTKNNSFLIIKKKNFDIDINQYFTLALFLPKYRCISFLDIPKFDSTLNLDIAVLFIT